ncbi:MAG: leucine-rich repeat protein, partial [Ruminococcus sp.]
MKNKLKKLTAITLSFLMTFSILFAFPISASAAVTGENTEEIIVCGDFKYTVLDDGTAKITKYIGSSPNVEIPYKLDGHIVSNINAGVFKQNKSLVSITIPDGVKDIKASQFYQCTNLKSITLPSNLESIGDSAFDSCSGLTDIILPDTISSIGNSAFHECSKLSNVIIPNSANIPYIDVNTFYGCYSLKNITIPDSVKYINRNAFACCSKLTDIPISNNLEKIGINAFQYCSALEKITLPDSITIIESGAFKHCSNLCDVTLPKNIKQISSKAFSDCKNLKQISIPHTVTAIGAYAFGYLTNYQNNYKMSKISDFIIQGYKGTVAEAYAKSNGFEFEKLVCSHNNMVKQTVEPTCTEGGYTVYTCNDCGETYKADYTDALGHDYEVSKTDSTCTSTGKIEYKCKVCGYEHTEIISELPHTYEERIIESSCSQEGEKICRCTKCGYTYTDAIPTLPHSFVDTVIEHTDCTDGYTIHKCSVCGYEYTGEIVHIENPVHNFKDGVCTVCGINDTYLYQSEHNYSPNTDKTWTVSRDGAFELNITFSDETEVEKMFDFIYIYDSDDNLVGEYTGTMLAGQTVTVKGNTAKIRLVTDGLNSDFYGFSLSEITAKYKGDVNGDGELTVTDVTDIQKDIADLLKFDENQKALADVNGDGDVDVNDVTILQKYIAGLIDVI